MKVSNDTPVKAFTVDPVRVDVPMPIVTPRLIIRPPQEGDGKALAEAVSETWDDLHTWFHPHMGPKEKETSSLHKEIWMCKSLTMFKTRERLLLLGFERSTGRFVINTGLINPDWRVRRFGIDYWTRKSAQGRGYATEATSALLRYAFGALSARVVTIGHAEGNEASRAIIEKLGFTHAIRKPWDYEMLDGTLVDGHGYYRTHLEGLPPLNVKWGEEAKERL